MKRSLAASLLALTACATVPRDSGVSEVQREVALRTGQNVEVRDAASADDARVQGLLQGELDADKAVAIALLNHPAIQVSLAGLGIARADYLDAMTIRNPVFGAEIRFPADPSRPYELSILQPLVDLIQLPRRRAAGKAAFDAAALRTASDVLRIAADVRRDFYSLVAATQHLTIDRQALEGARSSAELARRQHETGNITDLDFENEQAMYEQVKLDLARSEESALLGREALIRAMGLRSGGTEWKIRETFPPLPERELTEADVRQLLASRRLDIAAAQLDVRAFRQLVPGSRVSAVGDIDVDVHRQHEASGETSTGPGIHVPIPIFNRGEAARTRAQAQLARSEQRLAFLTGAASSEARAALQTVLAARSRVEYYRDVILPRRQRIVALTQLEQNAMLVGIFQLLQAKQSELDARRNYIEAQHDYWTARNDFDRTLSGLGDQDRAFTPATIQQTGRIERGGGGH